MKTVAWPQVRQRAATARMSVPPTVNATLPEIT